MTTAHWEHYAHIADIGIRGIAETKAAAFEQAALALTAVITEPACVDTETSIRIHCQAPDDELLFMDWLNALIYEMAVRHMLFSQFNITLNKDELTATVSGEIVNTEKHQPAVEIKGATATDLKVFRNNNGLWQAQCVVDV